MKKKLCGVALACISALACAQTSTSGTPSQPDAAKLQSQIRGGRAKNIILFIGDGMGDSEITAARKYQAGASGRGALGTLAFTGSGTPYARQERAPSPPAYVTFFAAGETACATGKKTSNGRISTSAKADQP